ncbi:SdpI family protein [Halorubrum trueperi]|uniref:SdpI family protein n=1 Tax=Halorubrum trueperi TaxID=2004704 RepID=A0ABD5UGK7_9EURY
MNTRRYFGLAALLVVLSAAVGIAALPALPERIVTHWDAAGDPNGTASAAVGIWLLPGLSAALLALFAVLPRIDPLGENVAAFREHYDRLVVVLAAYLTALHVGMIAFNLGVEFDFVAFVLLGVAGLFYYIGTILPHVEPNWFVGIRTPWTLSSDAVWDRTHALGAKLFKLAGVLAAVGVAFGEYAVFFVLVPAVATAVVTAAYSYVLYRRVDADGTLPSDE